jgi:hypothetical protein
MDSFASSPSNLPLISLSCFLLLLGLLCEKTAPREESTLFYEVMVVVPQTPFSILLEGLRSLSRSIPTARYARRREEKDRFPATTRRFGGTRCQPQVFFAFRPRRRKKKEKDTRAFRGYPF